MFREHEIAGSNPAVLTGHEDRRTIEGNKIEGGGKLEIRWVLCWYGRAAVNRFVAGSIPAAGASDEGRQAIRGSANGRPPDFESGNEGSIPSPRANS